MQTIKLAKLLITDHYESRSQIEMYLVSHPKVKFVSIDEDVILVNVELINIEPEDVNTMIKYLGSPITNEWNEISGYQDTLMENLKND